MQAQAQPLTPEALKGKRDGELARLYADAGSEAAFAELTRRYARLIYATCLRETQTQPLAEDASQGVFLLLSRKAGALKQCDTLAGWLYSASRYMARNLMKQERRRQSAELQAAQESVRGQEENALWERVEPHLNAALQQLKPADREAVLLRFVQEQSLAEIGACFGISENTARMRVARAVEKMRVHLGKAGIVLTLTVLTTLLERQSAQAVPAGVYAAGARIGAQATAVGTSETVMQLARRGARGPAGIRGVHRMFSAAVTLLLLGGVSYRLLNPQLLDRAEQRRLFAALSGTWQGSLEFADDKTRQHFTYPTTVIVRSENQGDRLQFIATYQGAANVDVTTFTRDPRTGRFAIENGGPQSSHSLGGEGRLVRLSSSEVAFQGMDIAHDREVQLRISLQSGKLTLQEEYRANQWTKYAFRNRFTLTK